MFYFFHDVSLCSDAAAAKELRRHGCLSALILAKKERPVKGKALQKCTKTFRTKNALKYGAGFVIIDIVSLSGADAYVAVRTRCKYTNRNRGINYGIIGAVAEGCV